MDNHGIFLGVRKVEMLANIVVLHLSNEQNSWLFRVYRGLYYAVMWGL